MYPDLDAIGEPPRTPLLLGASNSFELVDRGACFEAHQCLPPLPSCPDGRYNKRPHLCPCDSCRTLYRYAVMQLVLAPCFVTFPHPTDCQGVVWLLCMFTAIINVINLSCAIRCVPFLVAAGPTVGSAGLITDSSSVGTFCHLKSVRDTRLPSCPVFVLPALPLCYATDTLRACRDTLRGEFRACLDSSHSS